MIPFEIKLVCSECGETLDGRQPYQSVNQIAVDPCPICKEPRSQEDFLGKEDDSDAE